MRKFLLLTLLAALLAGCGTGPTQPDADQAAAEKDARAELDAGNYTTAAEAFRQLADDTRGPLAERYRLNAAEAYSKADDTTQVRLLLERLEFDAEEQPQLYAREQLLQARLALADDDTAAARKRLDSLAEPTDQPQLQADYHLLRAALHEHEEEPQAAVAARLAADAALAETDPERRRQLAGALWQGLRQLDRDTLTRLRDGARQPTAGWIDLAQIERAQLTNADNLRRTLDDWQLQYSNHPAVDTVLPELREFARNIDRQPGRVALLLPFGSNYDEVARTIRDGFIAGWYEDDDERPELEIYTADSDNIVAVYEQAVSDGAEFVVGPLRKEAVAALVEHAELDVPTLALNYHDGDSTAVEAINEQGRLPRLYQFSLAPEDEARQVAERAWFDGHAHALALVPANEWGDRIHQAFSERFTALGGEVLERVDYSPREQQFAEVVETLLNIDESERRYKTLRDQLQRNLESNVRRRQDADFIMLAGYPPVGRQIGPQLQYNYAGNLPVYATSHIFEGAIDRNADADMNGFIFADMPWLLNSDEQTALHQRIERFWPDAMDNNPRLFAFGIDAYRLLDRISRMTMDPGMQIDGASGRLSVTASGHIRRQLQWARFVNGAPQPLQQQVPADDSMARH